MYLQSGIGALVLPSVPGVGAGVLACPVILPGICVGIRYGEAVPDISPVVGVNSQ